MSRAAPATPRDAATVMVVRPVAESFEVFMIRRHQASNFAADLFAFPGGTVRADDRLGEAEAREVGLDPAALHATLARQRDPFANHDDGGIALWVAALRELFEEAGLLLAEDSHGRLLDLSEPARCAHFEALRTLLQDGRISLAALARQEGLRLAAERLSYFSRWITPAVFPRRFDARFFVAELPEGQTASHCQIETTDGVWISPPRALSRGDKRRYPMMFVTREHVRRLADFSSSQRLLAYARRKQVRPLQPDTDEHDEPYLTPEQEGW
jgi:8-oxo-dGTP pyrophosphatase MutT (NUDIX family)